MKIIMSSNAEKVKQALKKNGGYCPCAVNKNENTKCICKDFRDKMERGELGQCYCGLYEIRGDVLWI